VKQNNRTCFRNLRTWYWATAFVAMELTFFTTMEFVRGLVFEQYSNGLWLDW